MTEKQQFNVYLKTETVKQMKHRSIDEQTSLSDLVEGIFQQYLSDDMARNAEPKPEAGPNDALRLQPMLHVDDMGQAVQFFLQLGGSVVHCSRDGDWTLMRCGGSEIGLLARAPNPEQNEGKIELNFDYSGALELFEKNLRSSGIHIIRPTADEGFGYQMQVAGPDEMLIKINQIDPELYS